MLAIRLQRIGKKNRPSYRVVVSEKSRDLYGKQLEILGNYDPVAQPKTVNLKEDRIKHWISVGAQPSPTVHNILVTNKVIEGKKVQSWKAKKKATADGADSTDSAEKKATADGADSTDSAEKKDPPKADEGEEKKDPPKADEEKESPKAEDKSK